MGTLPFHEHQTQIQATEPRDGNLASTLRQGTWPGGEAPALTLRPQMAAVFMKIEL